MKKLTLSALALISMFAFGASAMAADAATPAGDSTTATAAKPAKKHVKKHVKKHATKKVVKKKKSEAAAPKAE